MQPTVITATTLRSRTREIMLRVKFKYERFIIQTFGEPMAILISMEDYEKLLRNAARALDSEAKPMD